MQNRWGCPAQILCDPPENAEKGTPSLFRQAVSDKRGSCLPGLAFPMPIQSVPVCTQHGAMEFGDSSGRNCLHRSVIDAD